MKTKMVNWMWAVASIALPYSLNAQSFTGQIKDSDGYPIVGATIQVEESYYNAKSDVDGLFEISGIPRGTYSIRIEAIGFENINQTVDINNSKNIQQFTMNSSSLNLDEVVIKAQRAESNYSSSYSNINKEELDKANFGQDLPYLLNGTPSTVVSSDAGAGVGYTGIRIRGVDPTRTNVTINGIPINDSESHGVWWVNMPDFASSVDGLQVQRGVGTSTNGTAAFGASINIKTDGVSRNPYAVLDNSVGSFRTMKNTVKAGTGLIKNKFSVDARMSRITSDGFIDRASSNLKSFYLSGAYFGKNSVLRANIFSGQEKTYQAWWGVPQAKYDEDDDALLNHLYNNYYPGGMYETASDSANLFDSGSNTYNYYWYDNETDNYQQDHYQLHYTNTSLKKFDFNISGFYTRGRGYYEQYKRNEDFSTYGFDPYIAGGDTITTTDVIRQRWLDNHYYGSVFTIKYTPINRLNLTLGGGANKYDGKHFGEVTWARLASQSEIGQRYYDNDASKTELNSYIKANYLTPQFIFALDLQARSIAYNYFGIDEVDGNLVNVEQNASFLFFNPKAGIIYKLSSKSKFYGSYSIANREPVRGDLVESTPGNTPTSEQLGNTELGYNFTGHKFFVKANLYHMNYKDQLILTGEINDVGAYLRTNVDNSYRAGIELEGGVKIIKGLSVSGNLTLSQNKIKEFTEYVDNYDNYDTLGNMIQDQIIHTNTDIAFSPNIIAALALNYEFVKGLELSWMTKYVGKQFLDNTSSADRSLEGYTTTSIGLGYSIKAFGFEEINIGIKVNNAFNMRYANNGYTWGYVYGGQRVIENFVYPQAGRNFLVRLALKM